MSETRLKIRIIGDKVLRRTAKQVKDVLPEHREILSNMAKLMYESSGIGLAAPQVGISESMIVVDAGTGLYKLINPKIVKRQGSQAIEEGCLSVPGVSIKVKRSKKILISALDENAQPLCIEADDLLSCVFQHEIDHLKGKLIVDYASFLDKFKIKKKLKKLEKGKDGGLRQPKEKPGELQL
ncbi:MAG: peptide deformylase [Candidatus Omnitrophota bacterium]|nr:MAG: peptide deformylase [Candidatus Omnitrophota bacterium]